MTQSNSPSILAVGSLAFDSIETPAGKADTVLGGSVNYFSIAASFYAPIQVVGVVGEDFPKDHLNWLSKRRIDVSGIKVAPGKTFHWVGAYDNNLNEAKTLSTSLNVFEHFDPQLNPTQREAKYIFLANIDPVLQQNVMDQVRAPALVACDSMNFWITSKLGDLKKIVERLDVILINEGEARLLTNTANAIQASREIVKMGPKAVCIKRGEYGFLIFAENQYFALPAYPIANVVDPTGAGDTFAGGFIGHLAQTESRVTLKALKEAAIYGTVMASFTVEDFSVGKLKTVNAKMLEQRLGEYKKFVSFN
jgi:sugar/nucleoside kinase (ribokinase family)